MQAVFHPIFAEAGIFPLGHTDAMDEAAAVERIRAAAKAQGVSQARLASVAQMPSQSAMSNVLKGIRKLRIDERRRLEEFLGIRPEAQVRFVPVIGLASAGSWNEAVPINAASLAVPIDIAGARSFGVEIVGDSMDKLLPAGGWAVCDPDQTELYTNKVYLIENGDHDVTVKQYRGDPARLVPVSNNEMHEPIMLANVPHRVIGRIVSYGSMSGL